MMNMHFCKEKEQMTKVTILQFTSLYETLSPKICLVLGNYEQEFRIKKKQVNTLINHATMLYCIEILSCTVEMSLLFS